MSTHIIRRTTATESKPALVTKADIIDRPEPAPAGDDYKFDLSASANDRHDILMVKFTVNKESQLPASIRMAGRDSDRDIDLKHQLDGLRNGYDAALLAVGRRRRDRVDTGEQVAEAHDVALSSNFFWELAEEGFKIIDIHAYKKPAQGKFGKDKYVMVCVFGRKHDELKSFEPSYKLMEEVYALATKTWQFLHVWSNPDGTATFNFGGRTDMPAPKELTVNDGRLGIFPC